MCQSKLNLTDLEDRIHRVYWNDGTLDVLIGGVLILIGIGWQLGQVALSAVIPVMAIPFWKVLRKGIVEPRMGSVVFSGERRGRQQWSLWLMVAVGVSLLATGVGLFLLIQPGNRLGELHRAIVPALPAALIGLAGIMSACLIQIRRLGLYGCAAYAIGVLGALLGLEPGIHLSACGILPFVTGIIMLSRFLREYQRIPSPESE